jgi:hypothetical protein
VRIRMTTGVCASPSFGVNDEHGAHNSGLHRLMGTVSTSATMHHQRAKVLLPLAASTASPKAGGGR